LLANAWETLLVSLETQKLNVINESSDGKILKPVNIDSVDLKTIVEPVVEVADLIQAKYLTKMDPDTELEDYQFDIELASDEFLQMGQNTMAVLPRLASVKRILALEFDVDHSTSSLNIHSVDAGGPNLYIVIELTDFQPYITGVIQPKECSVLLATFLENILGCNEDLPAFCCLPTKLINYIPNILSRERVKSAIAHRLWESGYDQMLEGDWTNTGFSQEIESKRVRDFMLELYMAMAYRELHFRKDVASHISESILTEAICILAEDVSLEDEASEELVSLIVTAFTAAGKAGKQFLKRQSQTQNDLHREVAKDIRERIRKEELTTIKHSIDVWCIDSDTPPPSS